MTGEHEKKPEYGQAKPIVAVVDDEADILDLLTVHLNKTGFQVKAFTQATGLLQYLKTGTPDLIVLDLMLPDGDGLDICKQLKRDDRYAAIPVIMLTARGEEIDVVLGLEIGADDYIIKPFSPKELIARVKAVMRRQKRGDEIKEQRVTIGGILQVDFKQYAVWVEGIRVNLTSTEFSILRIMLRNIGWVYSREKILDHLWGDEKDVLDRTIDVHIKNLREKLGPAGALIKNIRGVGYKIEP